MKYKNTSELEKLTDGYFNDAMSTGRPLTVSGLALALGTTRQTLLEYEKKDEFTDTIKRAKLKIENWTEEQLFTSPRTAGVIFNLTNNFGWINKHKERQDTVSITGWSELIKEADKILANHNETI